MPIVSAGFAQAKSARLAINTHTTHPEGGSMTRDELVAIVERCAAGSQEAARHTHVECTCRDLAHRRDTYEQGCYCPDCASAAAIALGYPPTDIEPEAEGPVDGPEWCNECGRLITLRSTPDLEWGLTADGALEELAHYETGLGFERGEPSTPDDWRVFLLIVDSIGDEYLPRVTRVVRLGLERAADGGVS